MLAAQRGGREAGAVRGRHGRAARARVRALLLTNLDEEHKHDEGEGELLAKAKQDWIGRLVALQGADLFRSQGRVRGHQAQLVADPKFGGDVKRVRYNEYNAITVAGSELQR